jgi:hypothetical protein
MTFQHYLFITFADFNPEFWAPYGIGVTAMTKWPAICYDYKRINLNLITS